jgi:predicted Zn-dependent peptidase
VYRKTRLRNGLTVVTERIPSVRSISLGIWVDVGSRHETPAENGLSHFIEHMAFKGTRKRNAQQIASALESIGGSINAFTSRETTCYVARILDEHLPIAVDVLSDITCNSTMTPTNLSREKSVICEEIKESLNTPADHIHDLFAATYWGSHPLGQPIMGSQENITGMARARLTRFQKMHYPASSVIVAAAGSVSHRQLVDLARKKFKFAPGSTPSPEEATRPTGRRDGLQSNDTDQVHFCLGFPGVSFTDPAKMSTLALNSYLGGGMSSVLFQKIREERGLAYTVYSFHELYRDTGIYGIYAATDKSQVAPAIDIVLKELDRVKRRKLPSTRLNQIKSQLKGQLTLALESTMNRMNRIARHEQMDIPFRPIDETLAEIDRLTPSDLAAAANRIFDKDQLALAALGPVDRSILSHVR